jgi:hypothetical protein
MYLDWNHQWRETILLSVPTQEKQIFSTQTTLDRVVVYTFLLSSWGFRWERCPNWLK